ncbi:ABC transporter permease [Streptomyces sp. NPDC087856]|uniref:ABC transporter permease n=1 Tax=Streptomyces sp. NPDC087856 TaxID=3365811 RepID=UPI0037F3A9C5
MAAGLSFRNISAVYIVAALLLIYSLWVPDTFLSSAVWRSLIDSSALTALAAVGLVLPLAAGAFDLAIGAEVGMGAIVVAWLLADHHVPVFASFVITVLVGAVIGAASGLLITKARIDPFIATLGMSSVLLALIAWLSGGQQLVNLAPSFQRVATDRLFGLTYPVWILLIVGVILWYVLERTPAGRRIYATGGNSGAARLAGVRTAAIVISTLAAAGAIAGLSGALVSSQLGTGDPTIGPAYLLPVYAAVFLGSTQFRGGRYNVWGTVLAVYVLAIGVKGLQLGGAPVWIPDLFNGVALILAVGLARFQRRSTRAEAVRRTLRRVPKADEFQPDPESAVESSGRR